MSEEKVKKKSRRVRTVMDEVTRKKQKCYRLEGRNEEKYASIINEK